MISTVSYDQHEILEDICALYNHNQPFDLDITYGYGNMHTPKTTPRIRTDLTSYPHHITLRADARYLPFMTTAPSIQSIIFDPPFIHAHGSESIIGNQFGSYRTQRALQSMYKQVIKECHRVIANKGILVIKCQDCIESGKQNMNHVHIFQFALEAGFEPLDLFILIASNRLVGWNQHIQKHARKYHSYFWVFRAHG